MFPTSRRRVAALAVAATVIGACVTVSLSGQGTTARAAVAPGATVRASVANESDESGGSYQELSADGTAVVFTSRSHLDEGLPTDGHEVVYVRDLRAGYTIMVSRGQFTRPEEPTTPPGTPPETPSHTPEPPPPPTFEPPRLAGGPLLSLNGAQPGPDFGEAAPNGDSSDPTISGDGRYIAFVTQADNIILEDADGDLDLLVCDRDPDGDGAFDEVREGGGVDYAYFRVNEPQYAGEGSYRTDFPSLPKLSDDASRIVWEDESDTEGSYYQEVVRTAVLRQPTGGIGPPAAVEDLDTTLDGGAPEHQDEPDVSADGRFVVLVGRYVRYEGPVEFPTAIPFRAVIRKDMLTGAVIRVDWDETTTPDAPVPLSLDESVRFASPAVTADGGQVAFEAEEYAAGCPQGCWYTMDQPAVYVVRVQTDGTPVDSVVASRDNDGEVVNGFRPSLSGDGRYVAFGTDNLNVHDGVDHASGLGGAYSCIADYPSTLKAAAVPPATEERGVRTVCQVVVRDLVVDRERRAGEEPRLPGTLASPGTRTDCVEELPEGGTCAGDDDSPPGYRTAPSLSRNGSTIAFDSWATDLVPGAQEDDERVDVYVRTFRPELRADPNPLEFGDVTVGETFDQVVRFDHAGAGPLTVTEVLVEEDGDEDGEGGGEDGAVFVVGAQTCAGETVVLHQTDSCEVSVTFAPGAEGERTGTLVVRLRDGREFTVPLRGNGTVEDVPPADARFAAVPDPLAFGDRLLLSEGPVQAVTVTNTGGSPLAIDLVEVLLGPADYPVAAETCTAAPIPPGGTCTVTIAFSPQASGARQAVLRFTEADGEPHLVTLTGTGSEPSIEVSPGVTPPGRVVAVTGTGFAPGLPVTITMADSVAATAVVPGETGTFTAQLLVLPKSAIGSRPVVATIDGTVPAVAATKPLLIVTPSVSPADFVIRG